MHTPSLITSSHDKGVDRVQNMGRLLEVRQVAGALDEGSLCTSDALSELLGVDG